MIRLVQKEFRRWLRNNERVVVGDPNEREDCPFCRFLKSKGAKVVNMTFGSRRVDGHWHGNTPWQRNFQKGAVRLQRKLQVRGLRGREALEALDNVTD